MENERFQLQNVAKTVEMAASSSKMLQIARKTDRKRIQKKKKKQSGKKTKQLDPKSIVDVEVSVSSWYPKSSNEKPWLSIETTMVTAGDPSWLKNLPTGNVMINW